MRIPEYHKGAHTVHENWYHIVWIPKYRRRVLTRKVSGRLQEILLGICQTYGYRIDTLAIELDHIHLYISIPPRVSVSEAIGTLKSISARQLFAEFPHLRERLRKGHLWARGYFVTTVSDVRAAPMIRRYLQSQGVDKPPVKDSQLRLF